jgi:NAD(P)-dependent dehydrogenase (short-subunit alcohol dehydrogenase family)
VNTHTIKNKIVLITGAGSGFGKSTAEKFASMGASLVLTDINMDALEETVETCRHHEVNVISSLHDVGCKEDWSSVLNKTEEKFGKLDCLINNAGYMLTKPYLATSLDEFQKIMRVNVESVWNSVQIAHPLLKKAAMDNPSGASVINLSSIFGQVSGFSQSAYSATKGAVRMLTKSQAVEFARAGDNIRVNSVHPGPGNTALAENGVAEMIQNGLAKSPEEAMKFLLGLIPSGRFADPSDISNLMFFLCSDASSYFTGSEFTLDGGYTAI